MDEDIKKSFVGFNENGEPILKLELATDEVLKRQKRIMDLHKEGKLKDLVKKNKIDYVGKTD